MEELKTLEGQWRTTQDKLKHRVNQLNGDTKVTMMSLNICMYMWNEWVWLGEFHELIKLRDFCVNIVLLWLVIIIIHAACMYVCINVLCVSVYVCMCVCIMAAAEDIE